MCAVLTDDALSKVSSDHSMNSKNLNPSFYCLLRSGEFVDKVIAKTVGVD